MCKRVFLLASLVMLILSVQSFADVGVFSNNADVGDPAGIGSVVDLGYVEKDGELVQKYLVSGGGADIWGTWDQFNYSYRELSGTARVSADFSWVARSNGWAKMGVMIRDLSAGTNGDAVHYSSMTRNAIDGAFFQRRPATGGGSSSNDQWDGIESPASIRLGVQRVMLGDIPLIEALYDTGSGWQAIAGPQIGFNMPDTAGFGVAVTSHDNNHVAQATATDVLYETDVQLFSSLTTVTEDLAVTDCPSDQTGFLIRSIKLNPVYVQQGGAWGWDVMNELLDTGGVTVTPPGLFLPGIEEGTRIDQVVNLRDVGDGIFGDNASFPGIDPYEMPAADPAAGDDDDNFATEILACVELTAGAHVFTLSSDDGAILEIGGMEIGRTGEWKGTSNEDFLFVVDADGKYPLRIRTLEGGGGASIEVHEVLADGSRVLLGNGPTAVYIPEPATIALLGFGGLTLLRIRKKS